MPGAEGWREVTGGGGGTRAGCILRGAQELPSGGQHPQNGVSPGLLPRTAGSSAPGGLGGRSSSPA